MENNKYFTPNIEDFHVGFEYEENNNFGSWSKQCFGDSNGEYNNELSECIWNIEHNKIRVSYLTKKQIEDEGWKVDSIYPNGTFVMQLNTKAKGLECIFKEGNSTIFIARLWECFPDDFKRKLIYEGECKDINTFRKIIKLLNIK